jgi:hypothetical protein
MVSTYTKSWFLFSLLLGMKLSTSVEREYLNPACDDVLLNSSTKKFRMLLFLFSLIC